MAQIGIILDGNRSDKPITNDSEATSSYTWVAKLHGAIKIYNGITAVTSDSAVNAQTNTIAEESNTGVHKIWSGSAWVEVA